MKFFADVIVHQNDSAEPDYEQLHHLLAEAGFVQRTLGGLRAQQSSSSLYLREEHVLSSADVEHDLRFVLQSFSHACSFQIHQAGESRHTVSVAAASRSRALDPVRDAPVDSAGMCATAGSYLQ